MPPREATVLLVRQTDRLCAIPLTGVVETMRPLPVEPVHGLSFLRGLAVIRGSPVPVVDLGALVGVRSNSPPGRFVLLRVGERRVAIAVAEVLGVRRLDESVLSTLPALLQAAQPEYLEAVAVLDERLLQILRPAKVIPDEAWRTIESHGVRHESVAGP